MKRILLIAALVGSPVFADIGIQGLYNTGLDSSGHLLAQGAIDPHYTVTGPGIPTTQALVANYVWPVGGAWVGNTATSQWVAPQADAAQGNPPQPGDQSCSPNCNYIYQTVFWISALPGSQPTLSLKWSSDNNLLNVKVNGTDNLTALTTGTDGQTYAAFHDVSVTGGFQLGANTLDFVVNNFGYGTSGWSSNNPTGLQVQFVDANFTVPEPSAVVLFVAMTSLLFAGWSIRKRLTT